MRDTLRLDAFRAVRQSGDGWTAKCPAHDDQRSSLSIGIGDNGRVLLKCHAGCEFDDILAAAGLEHADVFSTRPLTSPASNGKRAPQSYDYRDEHGALLFQVVRFEPKDFRQRVPNGDGWSWRLNGVRRVPYRLNELQRRTTVFVVEGEKDCDRLWTLGLPATTNAGGAGKWRPEFAELLKAAGCQQIVVLPDNDPPGEAHGRDVARSCVEVGLAVKLLPLPDLPAKGDVSDYLVGHSKDDLLALVKDAPLFNPSRSVTCEQPIALTSLSDLLNEPEDAVQWLVHDRVPAGAVVLFAAAPKTGKSTAARAMALAVSRGEPWLGWPTSAGTVWLLAFEDKRSAIRAHFRDMGATGHEPIRLFVDQAPDDLIARLTELAQRERPSLIVVDTLGRLIKAKDFNDYAEITQRFDPLLKLSRTTGATLFLLHHGSAHASREGLDAVLGSTAVSGSVDNILLLKRTDQHRVLSSVQRIGPDLEPTVITMDATTGRLERAGSKQQFDDRELGDRLVEALRSELAPVSESWLQSHVEGRNSDKVRVLRRLLGMRLVQRFGAGGRKDPYRYALGDSCSQTSPASSETADPREQAFPPVNPGLNFDSEVLVPEVPSISREQENKNSSYVLRTSEHSHDSGSLVPVVPERSGNERFSSPHVPVSVSPRKASSCSQSSDYERF